MIRRLGLAGLVVVAALGNGCESFGSQLDCGTVDPATCRRLADAIAWQARIESPDRRIVSLTIHDERGSYTLVFDDGSGSSAIVD